MAYVGEGTEGYVLTAGASGSSPSFQAPIVGTRVTSSVTSVSMTSTVGKDLTSISIPAGTWDISFFSAGTSSTSQMNVWQVGISTTSATFEGDIGKQYGIVLGPSSFGWLTMSLPNFRVTLGSTTTYYLVALLNAAGGTLAGNGTITEIKVAP